MPPPREQLKPDRKSRPKETMPGGWLWVVVLLLLGVVLYITFLPGTSSVDYSDFVKLVKENKEKKVVTKVKFREGANTLVDEFDPGKEKSLDANLQKQIRNHKAE